MGAKFIPDILQKKLIAYRRDFHRYPETAWLEMRTSVLVAERLAALGYEVLCGREVCESEARMGLPSEEQLEHQYHWALQEGLNPVLLERMRGGYTGVIGILRCGTGPTVALRFDLDALPIKECEKQGHIPVQKGFCSEAEGCMHACGHDGHLAIGLGTAEMLAEMKGQLHGTVKLIFQPAEEGVRGAKSIVAKGHLEEVDYMLGAHLQASGDGECHVGPGMEGTFATTKLDVEFFGRASHAAMAPQQGANAMLAAATAVLNLQAMPRDSRGDSRVNVGVLHAGSGRNVICDHAKMQLEVRGETTRINEEMEDYARRIINHAAGMHGCRAEIKVAGAAAAIHGSRGLVEKIIDICKTKTDLDVVTPKPLGGSEDIAFMMEAVTGRGGQACFTAFQTPCADVFHGTEFDFDERILSIGAEYFCIIVAELLGEN